MIKRLAVIAALTLASAMAFALPKPSDVKAAVASGNYAKAETMLLEVVREKPSARAHYDLGQVYEFEGKHNLALNSYRQAQVLDPTLKFASSSAEFIKKLGNVQAKVAPPPVVVAQVQPTAPPITYVVPSIPSTTATAQPVKNDGGGSSLFLGMLAILLLGGVAAGAFFFISNKREKKSAEDAATASKREKNTTLLGLTKSLEDATLIAKTATYGMLQQRQILDRIAVLQTQARHMLADLKDGKEVSAVRLSTLESNVSMIVDQATNGLPQPLPTPPAPAPEPVAADPRPIPGVPTTDGTLHEGTPPHSIPGVPTMSAPRDVHQYRAPAPRVVHHYHTPAPAPVVVNNNDGLLTGVLIGSMMNTHHDRVVEREVIVERAPRLDTPRYERDSYAEPAPAPVYRAPAPAPVFDSEPEAEDSYSAPAPAMDTSSSDDDTY
jgi:hypothetical protein